MSIDQAIEILCRVHTRGRSNPPNFTVLMGATPGPDVTSTEYTVAWATLRALRDVSRGTER